MSGMRMPTWKERENNKRRERRRRAISANIFSGLRTYGNFNLPKHCDNNEVLKALADHAGWTVEQDGTTYRKGCKPPVEGTHIGSGSVSPTPAGSSYQQSPGSSYRPSPPFSSIASPTSSSFGANPHPDSLIPWLKNLSSSSNSFKIPHYNGSMSAPVSSPRAQSPHRVKTGSTWGAPHLSYIASTTPPSPSRQTIPNYEWYSGSPTFSLVAANPFGFKEPGVGQSGSRMWTPGQSGTCSPAIPPGFDNNSDIPMAQVVPDEFVFGRVKPWQGERIHEECGSDELELTLGSSKTRCAFSRYIIFMMIVVTMSLLPIRPPENVLSMAHPHTKIMRANIYFSVCRAWFSVWGKIHNLFLIL